MNETLQKLVAAERKNARELKELRDLRTKTLQAKAPDQKVLAMIEAEIKFYTEPK